MDIPKGTRCELCGMLAVASTKDSQGVTHFYCEHHRPSLEKHADHSEQMFRNQFVVSLILTLPVLLYSSLVRGFLPPYWVYLLTFTGSDFIPIIFATIVFFYGGFVFIQGAFGELKARLPGMMTLIALAISVSYLYSIGTIFYPLGEPLFWELSSLITVMLLGHWIEMRAVSSASSALKELSKLLPDTAERLSGELVESIPVGQLRAGDLVLVRPGAKVPADGEIIEGQTEVNESMVTGESLPVSKKVGSTVIAGTVNGTGVIKVRVTQVGEKTALAGIMRLVSQAQASRSRVQDLADRAALALTLVAVATGTLTVLAWFLLGAGPAYALERAVAVLVIACPHALGLAIPLVIAISTTLSARSGLLVKEKLALELARRVDVVLFDKTGTLTGGELGVTDVLVVPGWNEKRALQWDASLEQDSEHAISRGIVKAVRDRGLGLLKSKEVRALPGRGVEGLISGKKVYAGGPALLSELKISVPLSLGEGVKKLSRQGKTVVYLVVARKIVAAFGVADLIRPESRQAVPALQEMGVRVAMLTGDAKSVAGWVARELGIKEYFAEVLPDRKVAMVRKLQADGSRVAMVGDGINDAPALTSADVGIAIGAGTDVAIESAGIILVKNDPRDVVKIIKLARSTYAKMVQNLVWATGYNLFAIPAAAGLFLSFGIILGPALSALLMSASTVVVALNAQLLRRLSL